MITVYALINGVWTPVGSVQAIGSGSNRYFVNATGLPVGQSYWFKIVDEANHTHTSATPVEVRSIRMEAVALTLETMRVTFNSEFGRTYQVKVSESLSLPVDQWKAEYVSVLDPETGTWSGYSNEGFQAPPGEQTAIQIPKGGKNKAFFKIMLVD
jgi:hypothetical protein